MFQATAPRSPNEVDVLVGKKNYFYKELINDNFAVDRSSPNQVRRVVV